MSRWTGWEALKVAAMGALLPAIGTRGGDHHHRRMVHEADQGVLVRAEVTEGTGAAPLSVRRGAVDPAPPTETGLAGGPRPRWCATLVPPISSWPVEGASAALLVTVLAEEETKRGGGQCSRGRPGGDLVEDQVAVSGVAALERPPGRAPRSEHWPMSARLIQFALTQRLLVLLRCRLAGRAGALLPADPHRCLPDVPPPRSRSSSRPRDDPEEVEARITARIEVEMLGIQRQTMLRSIAKYALTDITVDFAQGTDIYGRLSRWPSGSTPIWGDLPEGISGGVAPSPPRWARCTCSASRARP